MRVQKPAHRVSVERWGEEAVANFSVRFIEWRSNPEYRSTFIIRLNTCQLSQPKDSYVGCQTDSVAVMHSNTCRGPGTEWG
jgi:hypothetical protein